MCDCLIHRGPDAKGIFNDEKITFGHRRLAVLDTSNRANQPLIYSFMDREVVITYNGEIYNYLDIKKILEKKGYDFSTTSDTEVLCAAYIEFGDKVIELLDGMFAFAIYDKDKIFFARDFAGEKPFYYFYDGETFAFASELKALLKLNKKLTIDQESLGYYLSFNFIPAPYSIYKEIRKLPAASYGFFDLDKKSIVIKKYRYFPPYRPKPNIEKKIEDMIDKSVQSRLISDVPVGLILSGGLDSTTVAYFASKRIERLNAYTIQFEINDESGYAEKLAEELGINFTRIAFNKEDFYNYCDVVCKQHDEPFGDHSAFPTSKIAKFARKDITVALSGDGGDEVFGGYETYQKAYFLEKIKKIYNPLFGLFLRGISPLNRTIAELREAIVQPLENFKSFSSKPYRYMTNESKEISRSKIAKLLQIYPFVEALIKYDYTFANLPDHFLTKTDRATMNYALELRSPFLSKALWDFSGEISIEKKVLPQTKNILRSVMKNKLPEYILKRRKQGFGAPVIRYMIEDKSKILEKFEKLIKRKELKKHKAFLSYIIENTKNGNQLPNSIQYRPYALEMWFEYWWDNRNET